MAYDVSFDAIVSGCITARDHEWLLAKTEPRKVDEPIASIVSELIQREFHNMLAVNPTIENNIWIW